jgi:5-methylcytosine-specific restriction endonuclease McrA
LHINGKTISLQNRKFCLKCSSYKGRNTSPYDPVIRKARIWKNYSQAEKDASTMCNYYRALKVRRELYQKSGGKCQKCGYSKCDRALTFHHRNPDEKLFGLSLNKLWSKNIELIEKEWAKCDLLCMNCHAEVEDAKAKTESNIVARVNAKYGTNF